MTSEESQPPRADTWTEQQIKRLIREYRIRPVLWDTKNALFYSKGSKPQAWEEIGAELGMRPESCRHKMVVLLSSLRREKAKIMQSLRDGDPSKMYASTWFCFKDMSFLIDKEKERKRQMKNKKLNLPVIKENPNYTDILQKNVPLNTFQPKPKKQRATPPTPNIHEDSETSNNISTIQEPQSGPSHASDTKDEIKSFTNFIATKMRKYSEETKNEVQRAICDIIFKADSNKHIKENERKSAAEIRISDVRQDHDHQITHIAESAELVAVKEEEEDTMSESEFFIVSHH